MKEHILTDRGWELLDDNCYLCGKLCHPIDALVGRFYPNTDELRQVHRTCLIERVNDLEKELLKK